MKKPGIASCESIQASSLPKICLYSRSSQSVCTISSTLKTQKAFLTSPFATYSEKFYLGENVLFVIKGLSKSDLTKLYLQHVTFFEDAERIKKSDDKIEDYRKLSNLYTKICHKDLITAELTCYSKQWCN